MDVVFELQTKSSDGAIGIHLYGIAVQAGMLLNSNVRTGFNEQPGCPRVLFCKSFDVFKEKGSLIPMRPSSISLMSISKAVRS